MKLSVKSSIVTLALLVSTNAYASSAIVTSTINLRVGPGTQYGTIGAIPNGVGITVAGCTSGYGWCQVTYGGMTGWAASPFRQATATRRTTISDRPPQRLAYRSSQASPSVRHWRPTAVPIGDPAGVQALIAAGTVAAMSIMAASGVIASRTGDQHAHTGRTVPAGTIIRAIIPVLAPASGMVLAPALACVSAAGCKAASGATLPDNLLSGASPDRVRVRRISPSHSFHLDAENPY